MVIGNPSRYEVLFARVNATSDGDNTVIAAVAGKSIRVLGFVLNLNAAGVSTIQDSASSPVIHASFEFPDGGGVSYSGGIFCPAFELATGTALEINNAAGVDTLGFITYQYV